MKKLELYETTNGKIPVKIWLDSLNKDYYHRISQRFIRIENGNYGDFKKIDSDISELRFKFGSGYRVYFSEVGDIIILLLTGGDKSTQKKDIEKAREYLNEWRNRNEKI